MRVAFTLINRRAWAGGFHYQLNLFRLLAKHRPGALQPVVVYGDEADTSDLESLRAIPGVLSVHAPGVAGGTFGNALRSLTLGRDKSATRLFAEQRIDLVFEAARFFGWRFAIPTMAWIPDLQHRMLPQLFRARDYWRREIGFRAQILAGRTLLLSSEDSRTAFCDLYGLDTKRTRVARFAVVPHSVPSIEQAAEAASQYALPPCFVFMPGQFWQHKNHFIVIRALQILKEQGVRVVVLATGAQSDPRNPGHFGRVREAIRAAGLQEQLILPGQVPYPLVSALMRACSALLNPSLFEGWSTTVEEARAFGVPMILSDLAVHREQAGPLAEYFGKDDAEALAKALERVVLLSPADRNKRLAAGMTEAERRSIKFVRDFIEAAHAAIEHPAASL